MGTKADRLLALLHTPTICRPYGFRNVTATYMPVPFYPDRPILKQWGEPDKSQLCEVVIPGVIWSEYSTGPSAFDVADYVCAMKGHSGNVSVMGY